jgi:serine protease Do
MFAHPENRRVAVGRWAAWLVISATVSASWMSEIAAQDEASAVSHARALSKAFRKAASETSPSVVTVIGKMKEDPMAEAPGPEDLFRDPRFRERFPEGLPEEFRERFRLPEGLGEIPLQNSVGSGVIIDGSGIVLTNNHVVDGEDEVVVRLGDGREFTATSVTTDPLSDLAIVRFKAPEDLPAAALGDSDSLEIGDWVIAIGSPFELEATVSAGIISGKGRSIDQIQRGRLIQTDAAINPGNSGGPLVNLDGEVIGINTAIASSSGGYQGVGFAIPSNRAKWVIRQLIKHGRVRRAYLGIRIEDVSVDIARERGVPVRGGVHVTDVMADSPAAKSGMQTNDVITSIAGQPVRNSRELQEAVEQKEIDSMQPVVVMRAGKQVALSIVLKALPADFDRPTEPMDETPREP